VKSYNPVPIENIRAAQDRIADSVIRTPLMQLNVDNGTSNIYMKLENLQLTGSFKLRGVTNAIRKASKEQLEKGVWTVSSGNTAKAVSRCAYQMGLNCTVVVVDYIPETKFSAITQFGAKTIKVSMDKAMQILQTGTFEGMEGFFINVIDPAMMEGAGTIGLEIYEDFPDVDAVVVPYGAGGLICGIASALRSINPNIKIYASEVETGAPYSASLAAGEPVEVNHIPSFVDGISTPRVIPEVFSLAKNLINGSLVSSLNEVASAIKVIAEKNHIIAEGAAATSVAAALSGKSGNGNVVCVLSGGNIDSDKLVKILQGHTP
jgi:threonine dehydratase